MTTETDSEIGYMEITLENDTKGIYRYQDGEIFLAMNDKFFSIFGQLMYLSASATLMTEDGCIFINLGELEKAYPELENSFSKYRQIVITAATDARIAARQAR
jgi:hypothetical protein